MNAARRGAARAPARRRGRLRDAGAGRRARRAQLSPADRGLATELTYGVLKQRRRLDHALAAYAPRGIDKLDARVLDALRIGGLPDPVLARARARRRRRRGRDDQEVALAEARRTSPMGCCARWRAAASRPSTAARCAASARRPTGSSTTRWRASAPTRPARFLDALNAPAPLWLRANTLRATRERGDGAPSPPSGRARDPEPRRTSCPRPSASTAPATSRARRVRARPGDSAGRRRAACGAPGRSARGRAASSTPAPASAASRRTWPRSPATPRASTPPTSRERKLELAADLAHRLGRAPRRRRSAATSPTRARRSPRPTIACSSTRRARGLGVLRRHPEAKWRRTPDDVARARRAAGAPARRAGAARAPGRRARLLGVHVHRRGGPAPARALPRRARRLPLADGEPLRTWPHRDDADGFFAVRLVRAVRVAPAMTRPIKIAPVDPVRRLRPARRRGARRSPPPAPTTSTSTSWTATSSPTSRSARWSSRRSASGDDAAARRAPHDRATRALGRRVRQGRRRHHRRARRGVPAPAPRAQQIRDAGKRAVRRRSTRTRRSTARAPRARATSRRCSIMSVNPGFGGQAFIPQRARQDPRAARRDRRAAGSTSTSRSTAASRSTTSPQVVAAGANVFVAGSAIFETSDYAATIAALRKNAEAAALGRRRLEVAEELGDADVERGRDLEQRRHRRGRLGALDLREQRHRRAWCGATSA